MRHSTSRILTTHAGSLPRPADLLQMLATKEAGQPVDEAARTKRLPTAVKEIVSKQIDLGLDVIDDGEYSKPSFVTYVNERLGGYEVDKEAQHRQPWAGSREALAFPEFYAQGHVGARQNRMVCTGPDANGDHDHPCAVQGHRTRHHRFDCRTDPDDVCRHAVCRSAC